MCVNVCVCVCVRVCTHAYTHTHTHTHTLRKKEERFQGESDEEQHGKSRYVACDGISGFKYWVLKIISFRWTTGTAACMRACTRGSVQEAFRISRNKQQVYRSRDGGLGTAVDHAISFLELRAPHRLQCSKATASITCELALPVKPFSHLNRTPLSTSRRRRDRRPAVGLPNQCIPA